MTMHEKPILFSPPMVEAILAGHKTMTRRVVTPQPKKTRYNEIVYEYGVLKDYHRGAGMMWEVQKKWHPRFPRGTLLWVRERWTNHTPDGKVLYFADCSPEQRKALKWRPGIHMPRIAARIFLRVTETRFERLQDISDADAIAEGVLHWKEWRTEAAKRTDIIPPLGKSPAERFRVLWDSLNAARGHGWDTDTYVEAIRFEKINGLDPIL